MGYKVTAKLKIDLSEFGEDQAGNPFFAEMQHPKLLTFDQKIELRKFAQTEKKKKSNPDGTVEEVDLTPEEQEENAKKIIAMKDFIQTFLKTWNLIDIDTEEPIPANAGNAFKRVPSEVVETIFTEFTKPLKKESDETKNS